MYHRISPRVYDLSVLEGDRLWRQELTERQRKTVTRIIAERSPTTYSDDSASHQTQLASPGLLVYSWSSSQGKRFPAAPPRTDARRRRRHHPAGRPAVLKSLRRTRGIAWQQRISLGHSLARSSSDASHPARCCCVLIKRPQCRLCLLKMLHNPPESRAKRGQDVYGLHTTCTVNVRIALFRVPTTGART